MAEIISIPNRPDEALQRSIAVLKDAKPIAIPTETVYGLAADATNADAITSIYSTKGRPQFNPLICHMADMDMAERYGEFDDISRKLAEHFWPGALTIVVPLKPESGIHKLATAGLETVGIRVPKGFAAKLIGEFDKPLAAPSANNSGKISPTTAEHVQADLGEKIELILDNGACDVGVESTIVKSDGEDVYLLRPGGVPANEIKAVIGKPLLRLDSGSDHKIESPGMLTSHYAPNARMRLNASSVQSDETLITFGHSNITGEKDAKSVFNLSAKGDLAEAAHNLFDMLIEADKTGVEMIAVSPIPNEGLGEAINDRLTRAAAPR
jgi:L-threonylcarbamoyladenylate synthase